MPTTKCHHNGCEAAFDKPTKEKADQALRMHVGRVHQKNITAPNDGRALLLDQVGLREKLVAHGLSEKRAPRSLLTVKQIDQVIGYINAHRDNFATKTACFKEALKAAGATNRISENSVAVSRYFAKADAARNGNGDGNGNTEIKRKYVRRTVKPVKPLAQEVRVNFCPNCGCNIHSVATGMAMAKLM